MFVLTGNTYQVTLTINMYRKHRSFYIKYRYKQERNASLVVVGLALEVLDQQHSVMLLMSHLLRSDTRYCNLHTAVRQV